ncbi:hypothetical protein BC830DRAFT_655572 [Chytriomyces sp. MP71]|nr:hypothetical protein BC830DRAFT_655572 [Chytriomyces sp. MP71]
MAALAASPRTSSVLHTPCASTPSSAGTGTTRSVATTQRVSLAARRQNLATTRRTLASPDAAMPWTAFPPTGADELVQRQSSLTARERARQALRRITQRRSGTSALGDLVTMEATLEQIRAAATVFFHHGKEMWSREVQTVELFDMDLVEADRLSKAIRKDMEIGRAIMKVTNEAKLREAQVLLYTVMSKKLKELQARFTEQIKVERTKQLEQLKLKVIEAKEIYENEAADQVEEVLESTHYEAGKRRELLEKASFAFGEKNEEYHKLKFQTARQYLALKSKNVPGVLDPDEKEDAEKLEMVVIVDTFRTSLIKLDEEIRLLRPKIFQLEEEVDKNNQAGFSRDIVGIINETSEEGGTTRTKTTYVRYSSERNTPERVVAERDTREAVRAKLSAEFEVFLEESMAQPKEDLKLLQESREKALIDWGIKFKSAEALFDRRKLELVMEKQKKLLRLASHLVRNKVKQKPKAHKMSSCHLYGASIFELLRHELNNHKQQFSKVLAQLVQFMQEKDDARRKELERIAAEQAELARVSQVMARAKRLSQSVQPRGSRPAPHGQPTLQAAIPEAKIELITQKDSVTEAVPVSIHSGLLQASSLMRIPSTLDRILS